jgi:prepilin-type N-terminal cleavage/methylation domain-containing protein
MRFLTGSARGFSFPELLLTVAVGATIMAAAVPVMGSVTDSIRLNEATRLVERELQEARIKAVSANRRMRVRTNCPGEGFVRRVEVIGTSADTSANRCMPTAFPYPSGQDLAVPPNHDGPVRMLPHGATVNNLNLEFRADGTAFMVVWNVPQTITSPLSVVVTRKGKSRSVTVNGVGKIELQR